MTRKCLRLSVLLELLLESASTSSLVVLHHRGAVEQGAIGGGAVEHGPGNGAAVGACAVDAGPVVVVLVVCRVAAVVVEVVVGVGGGGGAVQAEEDPAEAVSVEIGTEEKNYSSYMTSS